MRIPTLSNWLQRPFAAELAPERAFVAVGDIHGRDDLLQRLLSQLDPQDIVVFVGDYIDRGEHSAQVLRRLMALTLERDTVICLKGNHEDMMLDFLDAPARNGTRWLRNGGLQTLHSFAVQPPAGLPSDTEWNILRDSLRGKMGDALESWLRQRPLMWRTGNVAVVHAGADPRAPLERQTDTCLMWGHPDFGRRNRSDGIWVVHGHTIVETPQQNDGVISIDTGAYATGILTAARIAPNGMTFQST